MPKYIDPVELTPFAQVLTDYMWNRRRPGRAPMAIPQLAAKLDMPHQNVRNWIYRSTVPTIEIILAVLARLDIPMRALYDAYAQAGLPVPRWDEHDTNRPHLAADNLPVIPRSRKHTTIRSPRRDRRRQQHHERGRRADPTHLYTPTATYTP